MSASITKIESKAQFDQLVKDTPIVIADCESSTPRRTPKSSPRS